MLNFMTDTTPNLENTTTNPTRTSPVINSAPPLGPALPAKRTLPRLLWAGGGAVLLIVAFAVWHRPLARLWNSLGGHGSSVTSAQTITPSTGSSPSALNTKSTSSTDRQTTNTSSTTSTTSENGGSGSSSGTGVSADTPAGSISGTADLSNLYNNVVPGMAQSQLTSLAGASPSACTQVPLTNDTVCTWTQNGKSVVVTTQNGSVVGTPLKVGF